jgi:type III pantothenate kinase
MNRLIAVDAGNSAVTLGLFEGESLTRRRSVPVRGASSPVDWQAQIRGLVDGLAQASPGTPLALCSVVDELTSALREAAVGMPEVSSVTVLTHDSDWSIGIRYAPPTAVGLDRIANARAAASLYGRPAVVVDMGTATTFDVVDTAGDFIGGAIAAGPGTQAQALHRAAPRLPLLADDSTPPGCVTASNTANAIASGILHGHAALVEGMVRRMEDELGARPVVIATGGWAETIAPLCRRVDYVVPDLTLHGIRLAWKRGQNQQPP